MILKLYTEDIELYLVTGTTNDIFYSQRILADTYISYLLKYFFFNHALISSPK